MENNSLASVKVGDHVVRSAAGLVMGRFRVTDVTADRIICGPWEFDRASGAEIDDFLEWGPQYGRTGTFITPTTGGTTE